MLSQVAQQIARLTVTREVVKCTIQVPLRPLEDAKKNSEIRCFEPTHACAGTEIGALLSLARPHEPDDTVSNEAVCNVSKGTPVTGHAAACRRLITGRRLCGHPALR